MRAWKLGVTAMAVAMAGPAVGAQNLLALPVGPGGPEQGPWAIAVWPYEGCQDCPQTEAERAAFVNVRDAILSGDYAGIDTSAVRIHLLPERPLSPADRAATTAELHALVEGCKIGSEGILQRSAISGPGVSYGLGFDCPGVDHRRWMSVNFLDGRLTHIYYLPRDPIWVVDGGS